MTLTPKQRIVNKANLEIRKDISQLVLMAKLCGVGELLYYLHYLHFSRLVIDFGDVPDENKAMLDVYSRKMDDAFKYLLQIICKHARNGLARNPESGLVIDSELVQTMNKYAMHISSKFESISFISTFNTVEVSGQRDQHARVNLEEIKDEYLGKFFHYGLRADREHSFERKPQIMETFFDLFKREYEPYSDLFIKEFGLSIDEFIEVITWIINSITSKIKAEEKKFPRTSNGKINIQAYQTVLLFGTTLFLSKEDIYRKFGNKVKPILERLTFKTDKYDEYELRFNIIERQPIIDKGDHFLISPEILLDSFFVNSHYSLLEAGDIKEEYKKRYAKVFVNKILLKANESGFEEFSRDFELYEGKNPIGDIDLIVKNKNNQFLLIEAKNHSIPMDVYFHDFEATKNRLYTLQNDWEKKVKKRLKHLHSNHEKYGIPSMFKYIIISKSPEIISHFSEFLILSLREFGEWLEAKRTDLTFQELYDDIYKLDDSITKEQLDSMQKDLFSNWTFTNE